MSNNTTRTKEIMERAKLIVAKCEGDAALLATVHVVLMERALKGIADAVHRRKLDDILSYTPDEPDEPTTPYAHDEAAPEQEQQDEGGLR